MSRFEELQVAPRMHPKEQLTREIAGSVDPDAGLAHPFHEATGPRRDLGIGNDVAAQQEPGRYMTRLRMVKHSFHTPTSTNCPLSRWRMRCMRWASSRLWVAITAPSPSASISRRNSACT